MRKSLIALALTVALPQMAQAGFTNAAATPINDYTHLECVPTTISPPDHDRNPTYKIVVDLQLNNSGVKEIDVVHVARDGTEYDRSQQYSNARVWQKSGYSEWYWEGTRKGRYDMTGRLYRNSTQGWIYEESLLDNGRQNFWMQARCHIDGSGD
jgi:hypothetical protein